MFRVSKERLALVGWNLFLGIPTSHPTTSIERKIVLMAAFSVLRYVLRTRRKKAQNYRGLVVVFAVLLFSFTILSYSLSPALSSSPSFSLVALRVLVALPAQVNSPEASPAKDTRVGNRRTYIREMIPGLLKTHRFAIYAPRPGSTSKKVASLRSVLEHVQVYIHIRDRVSLP